VHKQYEQARATIGRGLLNGPLAGVPYLIKDLAIFEAGEPARLGSSLYADFIADPDTKRAGLVIMGRSSTPESAHPSKIFLKFMATNISDRCGRFARRFLAPGAQGGQTVKSLSADRRKGRLVPIIPAHRLPTQPTPPMRRPIKRWGGRADCLHRRTGGLAKGNAGHFSQSTARTAIDGL
jgi:hypothetical protein